MKHVLILGSALLMTVFCGAASAASIVYTAYVVTDGQLGGQKFSDAQVTLQFRGDSEDAVTTTENGTTVYRNDEGRAMVIITQGASTTVARIEPHQIYPRYEPLSGAVGFGSYAIGPHYPIVMGCVYSPIPCTPAVPSSGFPAGQLVTALQDMLVTPADSVYYSAPVQAQQTDLRGPALLGGYVVACVSFDLTNLQCPGIPATAIKTDQGDLYFQGQLGDGKGIFAAVVSRSDD
jgi:hypothetical protein